MISDKDYRDISKVVYDVDLLKAPKTPLIQDTPVVNGSFIIIEPPVDAGNGMQAMAVAPIKGYDTDNKPIPDTSQVVIAYAGTNDGDIKDWATDISMIGGGNTATFTVPGQNVPYISQSITAVAFADQIVQRYPDATITITGHSLGGSLAMYVALKKDLPAITFNGPDIHNMISEDEIEYMQQHRAQFRNYRNKYDFLGDITGNKTKSAIYPAVKNIPGDAIADHMLNAWKFNKYGQLIDANGQVVSTFTGAPLEDTRLAMKRWKKQKTALSKGGLSRSEEIFLDSEQARTISAGIASVADAGQMSIFAHCDDYVHQAEELWNSIDFHSYSALSYWEVCALFSEYGVSQETIVREIEETMDIYRQRAEIATEKFTILDTQIIQAINTMLETDKRLAGDFEKWNQM
ncbi:TPA: alpha/beta fold hydrolase [Streptococcus suis]|uniref:Alpha/beta fold hydrolase n=5 Tax=Streptococcus TaxID=1301 RepID=A0A140EWJ0_STRSU|nr:alpha/beta fold hydrolase [Streptococcus suis]AEB80719.1 conserved hypothetical protein [Streptococcus suis ST3]AER16526.1 conserved hypothetical protein [Streptococcus suis D9]AGW86613.1 hypothetical protein YB51_1205 [Streptococcus suis YB51]AHF58741.1 hypothetical protein HAS68_0220 [Streptococcus suis 05HAS68]ALA27965.1 hypothetical protein AA105_01370 [Streptococcus suis]